MSAKIYKIKFATKHFVVFFLNYKSSFRRISLIYKNIRPVLLIPFLRKKRYQILCGSENFQETHERECVCC